MAAVLLGAALLLMGLVPPQKAHSKEKNNETAQSQQQEEQKAAPAEGDKAQEEKVLDKDPEGYEVVAGELLVSYEQGASEKAKDEAAKKVSGKVEKDFPKIGVKHVSVPEVKNERSQEARQEALERKKKDLEQDPDVEAVDYNYVREASWIPNDPEYGRQWNYPKINAPQAWDVNRGSPSVKIAILDSGIDYYHPDLKGKVASQVDFVHGDGDAYDDVAGTGHGTLVAGIAAANTNNGQYGAGTCPNCSLLIAKVLDKDNKAVDANVVNGLDWAASNEAKVINMSLAMGGYSAALEKAVNNAWGKGAVVVAAAGNAGSNTTTVYPAAYPNVIAVAATDSNDKRAYYEWLPGDYFGPPGKYMAASNAGDWVDVAAPGKDVWTAGSAWVSTCGCWMAKSPLVQSHGTSVAAPHVSGLAGLLFGKGSVSNAQVRKKIEDTTKDLGKAGKDPEFGFGRIDAAAALATAPTVQSTSPSNGSTGVPRNASVTATFSQEMDPTSISSSTLQLYQEQWRRVKKKGMQRQWVPVRASVSHDADAMSATLAPSSDLAANANHLAVVTTGAKDKAGNALAQNYSWTFTTGSS